MRPVYLRCKAILTGNQAQVERDRGLIELPAWAQVGLQGGDFVGAVGRFRWHSGRKRVLQMGSGAGFEGELWKA